MYQIVLVFIIENQVIRLNTHPCFQKLFGRLKIRLVVFIISFSLLLQIHQQVAQLFMHLMVQQLILHLHIVLVEGY